MNDEQTIAALRRAADAVGREHHLAPDAAAAAWSAAQSAARAGHPRGRLVAAVAASVAVTAGGAAALATWAHESGSKDVGSGGSACAGNVVDTPLPVWARAGWSPPDQRVRHVVGQHGRIVAIPFVRLRVHQPAGTGNKVLWVAKAGFGPLTIHAALEGSSTKVTRTLPNGAGPSYVNLPAAGCWRLDLRWGDQHDSLALHYDP